LGNGILRPETRRRAQPREVDRSAKWPSQTALDHANALYTRGDFGALGTTAADQDFLVVNAVLRNRSPKGFFSVNREFIANEAKNRGC